MADIREGKIEDSRTTAASSSETRESQTVDETQPGTSFATEIFEKFHRNLPKFQGDKAIEMRTYESAEVLTDNDFGDEVAARAVHDSAGSVFGLLTMRGSR